MKAVNLFFVIHEPSNEIFIYSAAEDSATCVQRFLNGSGYYCKGWDWCSQNGYKVQLLELKTKALQS